MNIKYNKEQTLKLYQQGLSDKEIASIIGCTPNQFALHRKKVLKLAPNRAIETLELTEEELSIVIGTLLGDSTIRYVHSKCKYPNLSYTHCKQQVEWATWKANKLSRLCSSFKCYQKFCIFTQTIDDVYCFTGKNLKCLTKLRETFYVNNKKILPIDFLKEHMTELSIYCLMMDDGHYDKTTNSFGISTHCFDKENLVEFCQLLKDKFNLNFSIKKDNSLYLKHESNNKMFEILQKYNTCSSMNYKCCPL